MKAVYRFKQFGAAVFSSVTAFDASLLAEHLSPVEIDLFLRQDAATQQHAWRVFHAILAGGCSDQIVLKSALLHDVGKSTARIRVWHRIVKVLLDWLGVSIPSNRLEENNGWWHPLAVLEEHADLGASLARRAGVCEEVVQLISDHHRPSQETRRSGIDAARLAMLQKFDSEF